MLNKLLCNIPDYFEIIRYKITFMLPSGSIFKGDPVYRCKHCGARHE